MATRAQKNKVAVFMIMNVIMLIAAFVIISGRSNAGYVSYTVVFEESILGLNEGGLVHYFGVPVGKVDDIRVGPDNAAIVSILVHPRTIDPEGKGLREGVRAKLEIFNLAAGTMCIGLEYESPGGAILPAGSRIGAVPSTFGSFLSEFQNVMEGLQDVMGEIKTALKKLNEETIDELNDTLARMEEFMTESTRAVGLLQEDVHAGVDDVREGIQDFRELALATTDLAHTVEDTVKEIHSKIEPLDLAQTESDLRGSLAQLTDTMERMVKSLETSSSTVLHNVDNVEHEMVGMMKALEQAVEAIRELAEYLKDDPASVLRGPGKARGD